MSVSKRIYTLIQRGKAFTEKKSFRFSLMTVLTFLFFFGTFNSYAQEGITPDWEGTKKFHNTISETDEDEDNMNSRQGLEMLNSGWTAISLIAPEMTAGGVAAMNNPDIPYDLKRGLLGMTEDAATVTYALYPTVNIPQHLAQMWVPGYSETTNSLYAQSATHYSGYQELQHSGITPLWAKMLNVSYVIFVIIMLVAGFMIMFRHKLGGQTVVTLGNVLPNVIVSLILATFSFAIAGLVIDLGGVMSSLVASVLGLDANIAPISSLGGLLKSVIGVGGMVGGGIGVVVSGAIGALGISTLMGGAAAAGGGIIGLTAILSNPAGWVVGAAIAGIVGTIGVIVILVVLGIILTGAIKVLITLYKAYFSLLISVILGPLQITLGAIPGNNNTVKNWFLSIVRNVMVFPLVLFIVNLPNAIANSQATALMRFPGKLVYEDPSTYNSVTGFDAASGVFLLVMKIVVLFFAAQAPKYLEAWFPAQPNKAFGEGFGNARASLQKIPVVGSLFK